MKRLVVGVAAVMLCLPPALRGQPPPDKLNVLFIISDDLNVDLGAYGAAVRSPHIDALAARGVRFEHAYTQYPLCSPSRSSLLTGRRPDATGVLANPSVARPLSPHLAINPRGHDREIHDRIFTIGQPGQFGGTLSWFADDTPDAEQTDGVGAREAVALPERFARERRLFFLGVGFYRPHTPYVAPREYFELYPADRVELPVLSDDDRSRTPAAAYASARKEQDAMEDRLRREAIRAYRAATTFMDAQVGLVLKALDRLGLAGNKMVVFTSDHGYHLGNHGLWQKRSLFEKSARVPLVIATSRPTRPTRPCSPGSVRR
jgi:arylsulfatase A-like enzyme